MGSTQTKARTSIRIPEKWWERPEYQEGELSLPGQSRLAPAGRLLLDEIATRADGGKLEIPPMPRTASEALKLVRAEDLDLGELACCLERDPVMTAQILRHANSALYGPATVIETVPHALSFLGLKRISSMVMEVVVKQATSIVGNRRHAQHEWQAALFAAAICRALSPMAGVDPALGYTVGLLHDIGRLPLMAILNARNALPENPSEAGDHEIILETLHRSVGTQLARAWDLPPALSDAIRVHLNGRQMDEDSLGSFPSTKLVEAAGDLCLALGLGRRRHPHPVWKCKSFKDLGIPEADLLIFLDQALPAVAEAVSELT